MFGQGRHCQKGILCFVKKYLAITVPKVIFYFGDLLHYEMCYEVILSDIPILLYSDIKLMLGKLLKFWMRFVMLFFRCLLRKTYLTKFCIVMERVIMNTKDKIVPIIESLKTMIMRIFAEKNLFRRQLKMLCLESVMIPAVDKSWNRGSVQNYKILVEVVWKSSCCII